MPSFKSIFLYATAALAGFASASPSAGGHIGREVDSHALDRRCGCSNIPHLFADMQSRVAVVSDNLSEWSLSISSWHPPLLNLVPPDAAVGVSATVSFEVIQPHLEMLRGALGAAVEDIHAMVNLDVNTILTSNGTVVSVSALAELVLSVFIVSFNHLTAGTSPDFPSPGDLHRFVCCIPRLHPRRHQSVPSVHRQHWVCPEVVSVAPLLRRQPYSACLAELLKVTFTIVAGLQVSFCGLLQAHADILGIVKVLGLVHIVDLIKVFINISL